MKAKVYEAVLETLETCKDARNNNDLLYAMVLTKLDLPTDLKELAYVRYAPSIESIARFRRVITNKYPSLKGVKEVERERVNTEGKYIEFAHLGLLDNG